MARTLDEVVTAVATELMAVNAATSAAVSQRVLADLVGHFEVDVSFLRHNDHNIHATRLVAEWPVRPDIPDPDPLGLVYFADADPVFAAAENAKEILVFRPEPTTDDYQRTIEEGRNIPATSMAVCADAVRRRHHGLSRVHQVRRQGMDAGGAERAQGDRIAVRAAASAHCRRRTSFVFSPSTMT